MSRLVSTRNKSVQVPAHAAVIQGLAPDGGLYTPILTDEHINIESILHTSYQSIAEKVIHTILDDYSHEDLAECIEGAYDDKFDSEEIVPLRKISDGWLMELWHGPTSAFKDIALTILPRFMTKAYAMDGRDDIISILTATSGDTGKAALSGFADVPHTAITVFYPVDGVSAIQKRQMCTSRGKNVDVIALEGNFDDCQRIVKQAASDPEVKASLNHVTLSSANSINIGRLVPQITYYFSSYAKLVENGDIKNGDKVNFVVPTGNFGDILAGYLAQRLGLPVSRLICASNTNNVLTDFLKTGTYDINRPFHTTMSPSMDILISSNLERLLFIMSDYDDAFVREMMKQLNEKGSYTIPEEMHLRINEIFKGYWCDEETCAKTIHDLYHEEETLIDPHTAVALSAMRQYRKETGDNTPSVVLSTASPYKFCKDVLHSINGETIADDFEAMKRLYDVTGVNVPSGLAELKDLPIRFNRTIQKEDAMHVIAQRMKEAGNVNN